MEMTTSRPSADVEVLYSGQIDFYNREEGWTESFFSLSDEAQFDVVKHILKGNPYDCINIGGMDLDYEAHFLIYSQDIVDGKTSRMHHMELRDLPKEMRESIIWNTFLDPHEQKKMRYSDFFEGEELTKAMQKSKRRKLIDAIESGDLQRVDRFELQTLKTIKDFYFDKIYEEYKSGGMDAVTDYTSFLVSCSQLYGRTAYDLAKYVEQYINYEKEKKLEKEEKKGIDSPEKGKEEGKEKKHKYHGR